MTSTLPKALLSWSSGKDSAYALVEARRTGDFEIVGLITTITTECARVSMHGVPEALLDQQLEELRLPCRKVYIPAPCSNATYERLMADTLEIDRNAGIEHVIFGDLFLEDIRSYREERLRALGMRGVFPLWGRDTKELAHEMIDAGVVATIACIDPRKLPRSFVGRRFDDRLLSELPPGVDPCGENGEFHTFVTAGPMFSNAINTRVDTVVERDGFMYADLVPNCAS